MRSLHSSWYCWPRCLLTSRAPRDTRGSSGARASARGRSRASPEPCRPPPGDRAGRHSACARRGREWRAGGASRSRPSSTAGLGSRRSCGSRREATRQRARSRGHRSWAGIFGEGVRIRTRRSIDLSDRSRGISTGYSIVLSSWAIRGDVQVDAAIVAPEWVNEHHAIRLIRGRTSRQTIGHRGDAERVRSRKLRDDSSPLEVRHCMWLTCPGDLRRLAPPTTYKEALCSC